MRYLCESVIKKVLFRFVADFGGVESNSIRQAAHIRLCFGLSGFECFFNPSEAAAATAVQGLAFRLPPKARIPGHPAKLLADQPGIRRTISLCPLGPSDYFFIALKS